MAFPEAVAAPYRPPPWSGERVANYREFVQRVRRHRPSDLLPALARTALAVAEPGDKGRWPHVPPWGIAAAAKASICHGNEHRTPGVTKRDVMQILAMHGAMYSHRVTLDPGLGSVEGTVGRIAYEQFPYQESIFEEVARTRALLIDGLGHPRTTLITADALQELLGASVEEFVGVAFLLHVSATVNEGYFDLRWLDQTTFTEINNEIGPDITRRVVMDKFSARIPEMRLLAQAPPHPLLPEHAYNPLSAKPFVEMEDGRLLAPQPMLVLRRATPGGIYYDGVAKWGTAFTTDLGYLFEDYIGRQARDIPTAVVHPEIVYGSPEQRSIDWFIVMEEVLLLVEAKTTRLPISGRAGTEELPAMVRRTLGTAFDQIQRTVESLRSGRTEFAHIASDLPMVALAVTLEPYYMGNSPFIRQHAHEPDIPTLVMSARDFEHLVGHAAAGGDIQEPLLELIADPDRRTWNVGNSLMPRLNLKARNPILDAAYAKYPWRNKSSVR